MTDRFDNYLSNYNFYSNSISFRIQSSKALEKFKNVQSFQLNQLVNGRFYFSIDRREILLLTYDMSSRFLYEMENFCIELCSGSGRDRSNTDDVQVITDFYKKTVELGKDIIFNTYKINFDNEFSTIWYEMHTYIHKYVVEKIQLLEGLSFDTLFSRLVDYIIEMLQYSLIEIHELDCLIKNLNEGIKPFMVITSLSKKIRSIEECPFNHRLSVYKKHFGLKSLYLKNYTDHLIPEHILNVADQQEVEIDFRKTIFDPQRTFYEKREEQRI